MPHTTENVSAEIRPWRRVRITESWLTDRMHNAASSAGNQTLTGPQDSIPTDGHFARRVAGQQLQQAEVMLFFEVTPRLTLRSGYRYVWGDANDATLPPEGLVSADRVHMRRNVGMEDCLPAVEENLAFRRG